MNEVVGENRVPSPDSFNVTGLLIHVGPVLSTWNVHACALCYMHVHIHSLLTSDVNVSVTSSLMCR